MQEVIKIDSVLGILVLDGFTELEYAQNWLGCNRCGEPINDYGEYPSLLKLEQYMVLECLRLRNSNGEHAPCLSK